MAPPTATLERPPAHMDPRIRARRIDVQRGMGRRRLQRLVDVGLLLAVVAGFAVALRSPALDVEEVVLRGNEHTSTELVLERSGIEPGDQLMDVDLRAAGQRVAQLPWIDDVRLHRGLDGRVQLRVTERTPVAVVGVGDDAVIVDREGRALARTSDEPALGASLVTLVGLSTRVEPGQLLPGRADAALGLATRLAGLATLAPGMTLELAVANQLVGTLDTGAEVRFGAATQLAAKVRSLRTVLEQVDLTCAAVIDVRSPGSPVLTREEGCS